jgi:hypothetical protein
MFGGPWLGVIVFVIIAIGLGWGLISLLQQQLKTDSQSAHSGAFEHDFEPEQAYQLKRDLMLGYLADGRIVLLPGREDLPPGTTGRRTAPSIAEYRENPNNFPEHIGVVDAGTRVQFVEVIDDRSNPQTRILVMTRLLTGTYARETPVLGMHLESTDTDEETGNKRYGPRSDLFEMIEEQASPVQSNAEDPDTE